MTSRTEVTATLDVANELRLMPVPDRLQALPARMAAPRGAVALLGLIKRGKSTLFNRLLGAEPSAVAAPPETVATVSAMSGQPSAAGRTEAGCTVDLPHEPASFREAARRHSRLDVAAATISGDFRLPGGITLIDTPGIDEATDLALEGHRLEERWKGSGAGAAVVVLSVPPGLAARDLALIQTAQAVFPDGVSIVLKATSAGIPVDDLHAVADYSSHITELPILCLPDEQGHGDWGTGPLGELERMISDLATTAEQRYARDLAAFDAFVDALIDELATTTTADLASLTAVTDDRLSRLPEQLAATLRSQVVRLEAEAADARRRVDHERDRPRRELLDRSAERLISTAQAAVRENDAASAKAAYADVHALAVDGSGTAQDEIRRLLTKGHPDRTSGLELAELLSALPAGSMRRVCSQLKGPADRLVHALRSEALPDAARRPLERRAAGLLRANTTHDARKRRRELAGRLAGCAQDPEVRRSAATVERELLFQDLAAATREPVTKDLATWRSAWSNIAAARSALAQHRREHPELEAELAHETRLLAAFAERAADPLRETLHGRYRFPVADVEAWIRLTSAVEAAADELLPLRDDEAMDDLRRDLDASRRGREAWLDESARLAEEGARRHQRAKNGWDTAYYLSFALWIAAFFVLTVDAGAAFLTWVLAVAAWLVARPGRERMRTRSWSNYAAVPPPPMQPAPILPRTGWYPDPASPQGQSRWWNSSGWTHVVYDPEEGRAAIDAACDWHVPAAWLPDPTGSGGWCWWTGAEWERTPVSV